MPLAPDVPYEIGEAAFGGYVAGLIDTTQGNIITADASQTGQRYVLIVAPASLETTKQWKTSQSAGPAASRTRWDGLSATQAMNSSTYPAAQYCAGLSYPSDAGSPWYLPAMDELEVIYRNLKATTESNNVATRTDSEFPGTNQPAGYNPSSDPNGTAYTTTNPSQTTVAAFRDGGGQDLGDSGTNLYFWTATEYNAASLAWVQYVSGFYAGYQSAPNKTNSNRVRPVRRILVSDLNTAPNAPILTAPADASAIDRNVTQRFDWDFSDPDTGDTQSKYDLRYRVTGAATWTTVTNTTPNTYHDFAPGSFAEGDCEWQVRTYDAQGVKGPFSASWFFTAETPPPGPTITAPTNGSTIHESTATLTWSYPTQTAYQAQVLDGGTVVYDTGEVASETTRSVDLPFPTNDVTRTIRVRIKEAGLWSGWSSVTVSVSYTPPPAPSLSLLADDDSGSLVVTVTNPAPGAAEPSTSYNEVWIDDGSGEQRKATTPPNSSWTYWLPRSGRDYSGAVRVVAVADNGTETST